MKIYLNRKPVSGPWGGGNKTLSKLCDELVSRGHDLVFNLQEGIDLIFCYDPRPDNTGVWYQHFINYKNSYPGTRLIQRVGDVGTHSKPELTQLLTQIVDIGYTDFFIFPSEWARQKIGHKSENFKIIQNRPLDVFYNNRSQKQIGDTVKIVTHHWSTNEKKGFAFYEQLSNYMKSNKVLEKQFELTYIGRYNNQYKHDGWRLIEPVDKVSLSQMLPSHDVYLTASVEEAGANHVLEAMAAGLPVIYHNDGGSICEYCSNIGIGFSSNEEFESAIKKLVHNFKHYKEKALNYNEKISTTIDEYIQCIETGKL